MQNWESCNISRTKCLRSHSHLDFVKYKFKTIFFNFYFLKVFISVTASYPFLKCLPPVHNIGIEGRVSQIFHLGLSLIL